MTSNNREYLVATTSTGNVMKLHIDKWEINPVKIRQSHYDNFCLVYPLGKYVVTLAQNNLLSSWDIHTGLIVSSNNREV